MNSIVKLLALTHSAALASFSEEDKESAMLQVIMSELGNLRNEIRNIPTQKETVSALTYPALTAPSGLPRIKAVLKEFDEEVKTAKSMLDSYIKGEIKEVRIDTVLNYLSNQSKVLVDTIRNNGTDEDMEHIALLTSQLNVLQKRYRRHLQRQQISGKDDNE